MNRVIYITAALLVAAFCPWLVVVIALAVLLRCIIGPLLEKPSPEWIKDRELRAARGEAQGKWRETRKREDLKEFRRRAAAVAAYRRSEGIASGCRYRYHW